LTLVFTALGLGSACGGGTRAPSSPSTLYVDAAAGSDDNLGTETEPLRTITKALELLTFRSGTVVVAPGTYDAAHGESFPLQVPNRVALIGDAANRGQGTRWTSITGFAQVSILPAGNPGTVVMGEDASITGFVVGAGHREDYNLSLVLNARAQVVSCTLPGWRSLPGTARWGTAGVVILPGLSNECVIRDCVIEGHSMGISLGYGSFHLVEANVIRGNHRGVQVQSSGGSEGADLGGGVAGSLGRNVIAGNGTDLDLLGDTHVSARDCVWDHAPPEIYDFPDPAPEGADIVRFGTPSPTVDVTGASVVTP
jgi:hypothetical protein